MKLLKERIKVLESQLDAADDENARLRAELDSLKNDYANLESAGFFDATSMRGSNIAVAESIGFITYKQSRDMVATCIGAAGRLKDVASKSGLNLVILGIDISHSKGVAKFRVFLETEEIHFKVREDDLLDLLNGSDLFVERFLISALQ